MCGLETESAYEWLSLMHHQIEGRYSGTFAFMHDYLGTQKGGYLILNLEKVLDTNHASASKIESKLYGTTLVFISSSIHCLYRANSVAVSARNLESYVRAYLVHQFHHLVLTTAGVELARFSKYSTLRII